MTTRLWFKSRLAIWLMLGISTILALTVDSFAQQRPELGSTSIRVRNPTADETELPYNQAPVNYSTTAPDDPVSRLQKRMVEGAIRFKSLGESGVLKDLLDALCVPVSSQLLVFSKSSANARLIEPKTPRAIYFNDDIYVGWVPGSDVIEISAADPRLGGTFYSLRQSAINQPVIQRDESCLLCHLTRSTLRVPGHLVRSFTTDSLGNLRTGWSRITHETPFHERWAGWYVTGAASHLKHIGNVFGKAESSPVLPQPPFDLSASCDPTRYLTATSDVVPHLVLDHQAHGHNLITRLNYEARLGKPMSALEPLVRYLLFLDERTLPGVVTGSADYKAWFEQQGIRDDQGRSLRQFDLQTRLFKYPLSYLVQTNPFTQLPDATRREVWLRIKQHLTDRARDASNRDSAIVSQSIIDIVRSTARGLPADW